MKKMKITAILFCLAWLIWIKPEAQVGELQKGVIQVDNFSETAYFLKLRTRDMTYLVPYSSIAYIEEVRR